MKFIIAAFFFFVAFCLQQKPLMNFSEKNSSTAVFHNRSDEALAFVEILEVVLTGHVNHTHEHNDHDEDATHNHPHEHASLKFTSFFDFLPVTYILDMDKLKLPWPSNFQQNSSKSFQTEILRPPIV